MQAVTTKRSSGPGVEHCRRGNTGLGDWDVTVFFYSHQNRPLSRQNFFFFLFPSIIQWFFGMQGVSRSRPNHRKDYNSSSRLIIQCGCEVYPANGARFENFIVNFKLTVIVRHSNECISRSDECKICATIATRCDANVVLVMKNPLFHLKKKKYVSSRTGRVGISEVRTLHNRCCGCRARHRVVVVPGDVAGQHVVLLVSRRADVLLVQERVAMLVSSSGGWRAGVRSKGRGQRHQVADCRRRSWVVCDGICVALDRLLVTAADAGGRTRRRDHVVELLVQAAITGIAPVVFWIVQKVFLLRWPAGPCASLNVGCVACFLLTRWAVICETFPVWYKSENSSQLWRHPILNQKMPLIIYPLLRYSNYENQSNYPLCSFVEISPT